MNNMKEEDIKFNMSMYGDCTKSDVYDSLVRLISNQEITFSDLLDIITDIYKYGLENNNE